MKRVDQAGWFMLLALLLAAATAPADTVRLKNGTQYEGTIQSETDSNIEIEVANPAGTIFHSIELNKADVAEAARTTPEQRAVMEMENSYKQTLKYQLDPQYSQPLPYYNQIISNVFNQYLNKYPGSPHEKDMAERIASWTEEREKVASGLGRVGTEWLPAAEVAKRTEVTRVMAAIENGNKLASEAHFEEALNQLRDVPNLTRRKDLVDQAKHAYADIGRLWIESLERQRDPIKMEIQDLQERMIYLRTMRDSAESKLRSASQSSGDDGSTRRIGGESLASQFQLQYDGYRNQYDAADHQVLSLRQQEISLETAITRAKTLVAAGNSLVGPNEPPVTIKTVVVSNPPPAAAPPTVAAKSEDTEPTPDVLVQVADYFKRYWIIGLVGFVVIAWACTRAFSR
jgi:hypothetical protein